jgi:hypothetical protein
MGLRNLPYVDLGGELRLSAGRQPRRLLGLYDCDDLKDAEPDTLRDGC